MLKIDDETINRLVKQISILDLSEYYRIRSEILKNDLNSYHVEVENKLKVNMIAYALESALLRKVESDFSCEKYFQVLITFVKDGFNLVTYLKNLELASIVSIYKNSKYEEEIFQIYNCLLVIDPKMMSPLIGRKKIEELADKCNNDAYYSKVDNIVKEITAILN